MDTDHTMNEYQAREEDVGTRADVFLSDRSGLTRSRIKRLMVDGCAVFTDGSPVKPSYPVESGDVLHLTIPPAAEPVFTAEDIPLDIVYEDSSIIVVNKPPGMVVHPGRGNYTGTLASALLSHCTTLSTIGGGVRPGIVHRLDKDTSGLIVAALTDEVHVKLASMIKDRTVSRTYTAYVWGRPDPESDMIDAPVGRHPKKPTLRAVIDSGKPARTEYETVERFGFLTKLVVRLETGRTHQIRIHLAHINHHVFGDPVYGGREERLKGFSPDIRLVARRLLGILDRQALHAARLAFIHPVTGEEMVFEAPLPADLTHLENELRK